MEGMMKKQYSLFIFGSALFATQETPRTHADIFEPIERSERLENLREMVEILPPKALPNDQRRRSFRDLFGLRDLTPKERLRNLFCCCCTKPQD